MSGHWCVFKQLFGGRVEIHAERWPDEPPRFEIEERYANDIWYNSVQWVGKVRIALGFRRTPRRPKATSTVLREIKNDHDAAQAEKDRQAAAEAAHEDRMADWRNSLRE